MSRHAIIRQQQRAIDDRIIELLQLWGRRQHDGHGGHRVWFDKRARRKLTQELDHDEYVRLERKLNTYAVVSANGTVITVARITRRTRR